MKTILLLISGFLFTAMIFAESVSTLTAKKVAQAHYSMMADIANHQVPDASNFNLVLTFTNAGLYPDKPVGKELNLFYVFNVNENDGFVIISADDRAFPILGYSLEGTYSGENLPPALSGLLNRYGLEMDYIITENISTDRKVAKVWSDLMTGNKSANFSITSVGPLISTQWNQAPYYNDLCPYDNNYNELTVTGCPATAMAQIMKFWSYPEHGTSYHSYNSENYGTLSANFEATNYDWAGMPNSLNGSNNAIATLMFHCGVGVEMQYGVAATGGSGGYVIEAQSPIQHCCEYAFKTYFGYKTTMQGLFRDNYNDATWTQMLKTDLDAGRPIQYAGFGQGGGHTWVCDGYDVDNYFHMNWGWGGTYDGFFSLNNLAPGTGGAGGGSGNFNSGQQALIGIEPLTGGSGGGTQFDLRAYSQIVVDPNPISFTYAFSAGIQIGNYDDADFSGNLAAWLFNEDGNYVDVIQEITGVTLLQGDYNTYYFQSEGMLATPGTYYIGIYYKATGGDWAIIGAGDYGNYASVEIVGPDNTMQMYSDLVLNPETVVSNESFQITFDIGNYDSQNFSGTVTADLYDAEGTYLGEMASTALDLSAGYFSTITFTVPGLAVDPGSYILAIWDQPAGGDWLLVGSVNYSNPIMIEIAAPQLPADIFENNDDIAVAYNFPLNFSGNQAIIETTGSTIHNGNDLDFYKVDLPSGYQYKFTIRAHDSYNSGNGITYTNDVLWAVGAGGWWSEVYDDIMEGSFAADGGQSMFFAVSNYYQGNTGSYLLEIMIEKGTFGVEELNASESVNLYPNPANSQITLSSGDWSLLKLPLMLEITDMSGRMVYSEKNINPQTGSFIIDVANLKEGQYNLHLQGQNTVLNKKLMIVK